MPEIWKCICQSHRPQKTTQRLTSHETEFLYYKMSPETNKLLSSLRAFLRHLKSATCPLTVWHSAKLSITMTADHLFHVLEMKENGILMPVWTHGSIAVEKLVDVASCNCNGDFGKGWSPCRKRNVLNIDICSCSYKWQNTNISSPTLALNVNMRMRMTMRSFENQTNVQRSNAKNLKNTYSKFKNFGNMRILTKFVNMVY